MLMCLDLVSERCMKVLPEGNLPGPIWCLNRLTRLDQVAQCSRVGKVLALQDLDWGGNNNNK